MAVCSSPLGAWMEATWPAATKCCQEHDNAYERGGDGVLKMIVDLEFWI